MFRKVLIRFTLALLLACGIIAGHSIAQSKSQSGQTGTLEKMIVAGGSATMKLDLNRLNGAAAGNLQTLHFNVAANSYFAILVLNDVLRGPDMGSMGLMPLNSVKLPGSLGKSFAHLVLEQNDWEAPFQIAIKDSKTGFTFFNIEGHGYDYDAKAHLFRITDGRLLISPDFAKQLGRPADAGAVVGNISSATTMTPIEIAKVVNGAAQSVVMPGHPEAGTKPGPDVIVGDLPSMDQGGSSGSQVGLEIGTTSCNNGVENLDWFQLPNNDHPVIPQNFYRMSGGANNTERFEQIGQSWLKHAFTALTQNVCSFGCNGVGGSHLGSGCSDPYSAGLNGSQNGLGSRAWVNPFTGAYPGSNPSPANHSGHSHNGTSHRVLVNVSDLNTTLNPGATYFGEGQYVTPHEYAWCQAHAGECNMYNNVSYRQFTVSGTTSFSFSPAAATVRTFPAITAWTGATLVQFEPDPGNDGIGIVGYKVTNTAPGVWHYEYAVYNENLDRGVQSFSIPVACGVNVSNVGFHAPLNPPGFANDGTLNDAGYSNTAWTTNQSGGMLTWSSETLAQNQNANALRWGTLYNFRFDADQPPQAANATLGYFKTGSPSAVAVQGPMPGATCNPLQIVSAVSEKVHGAAGTFDIPLPLSGTPGVECRDGAGAYTFVVTFSNMMATGTASVTGGSGSVAGSPVIAGNTMTVQLTGVTNAQVLTVTLANLSDSFGQTLADTPVSAGMLIGDTNGNGMVSSSDISQVKASVGASADGSNFRTDVNVSGAVSSADIAETKANSGQSVQ